MFPKHMLNFVYIGCYLLSDQYNYIFMHNFKIIIDNIVIDHLIT